MLINLEEYELLKNEMDKVMGYIILNNKLEDVRELINEYKHFYNVLEKAIETEYINKEDKRELIIFVRENIADSFEDMTVEEIEQIVKDRGLAELYYKILNEDAELSNAKEYLLNIIHDMNKEERDVFFKVINILNEVFK